MVADWSGSLVSWEAELAVLKERVGRVFGRLEVRRSAGAFIDSLLVGVERKTALAESLARRRRAGEAVSNRKCLSGSRSRAGAPIRAAGSGLAASNCASIGLGRRRRRDWSSTKRAFLQMKGESFGSASRVSITGRRRAADPRTARSGCLSIAVRVSPASARASGSTDRL